MFNLTGNCNLFQMALPFCIPTSSVRAPINTHPVNTDTSQFCLPPWLKWPITVVFILIPQIMILGTFAYTYSPFMYLFVWNICSNLLPDWVVFLCVMDLQVFYLLDTSSLSNICIPNIFSQSVTYHFIFLKVSFE